ncbi:hypothetical protein GY45DRAFT_1260479, partial [Cubamyces sp. BRFM 1775]
MSNTLHLRRPSVPRPASTPPTSQATSGTRASAPSATATRRSKSRKPTSSQEAWLAAEDVVPNLNEAIAFLQAKSLIPEGSHAITGESLVSGLLHFAFTAPSHELAREGLIAFAYLAKETLSNKQQEAVSGAIVERAEDQLSIRLDHHTSHVEDRIAEFAEKVDSMKEEMSECTLGLRDACERVRDAERALLEMQREMRDTGRAEMIQGVPAVHPPPLTLEAAPARVRRAATLADLLQRQVLVRAATLQSEDGQRLNDGAVLERARHALEQMEREGLSPPGDGAVEQAKVLAHGDTVFTMSTAEAARWLLKPTVAKPFARKMGLSAQVIE